MTAVIQLVSGRNESLHVVKKQLRLKDKKRSQYLVAIFHSISTFSFALLNCQVVVIKQVKTGFTIYNQSQQKYSGLDVNTGWTPSRRPEANPDTSKNFLLNLEIINKITIAFRNPQQQDRMPHQPCRW